MRTTKNDSLIFCTPPKYNLKDDPNDKIYKTIWGNLEDPSDKVNPPQLFPVDIEIGSPRLTAFNVAEDVIKGKINSPVDGILKTYIFGKLTYGSNKLKSMMEMIFSELAASHDLAFPNANMNPFKDSIITRLNSSQLSSSNPKMRFYASDESSISESVTNNIGDSAVKSFVDRSSATAREITGLTGTTNFNASNLADSVKTMFGSDGVAGLIGQSVGAAIESGAALGEKYTGNDAISAILKGSQIILPEIWQGSSFVKSYSLSFRLYSPSGDVAAIVKNVIVPLNYLFSFALPVSTGPNTVNAPFIIRVNAPGIFVIPMGIVTNVSIRKGGRDDVWSSNLMPRSIDVTLEIADLRPLLPLPAANKPLHSNMVAYLTNIAGQNYDGTDPTTPTDTLSSIKQNNSNIPNTSLDVPGFLPNNTFDNNPSINTLTFPTTSPLANTISGTGYKSASITMADAINNAFNGIGQTYSQVAGKLRNYGLASLKYLQESNVYANASALISTAYTNSAAIVAQASPVAGDLENLASKSIGDISTAYSSAYDSINTFNMNSSIPSAFSTHLADWYNTAANATSTAAELAKTDINGAVSLLGNTYSNGAKAVNKFSLATVGTNLGSVYSAAGASLNNVVTKSEATVATSSNLLNTSGAISTKLFNQIKI